MAGALSISDVGFVVLFVFRTEIEGVIPVDGKW